MKIIPFNFQSLVNNYKDSGQGVRPRTGSNSKGANTERISRSPKAGLTTDDVDISEAGRKEQIKKAMLSEIVKKIR